MKIKSCRSVIAAMTTAVVVLGHVLLFENSVAAEPGGGFESLGGCPSGGTVTRGGWSLEYEVTDTDGLRTFNIEFQGAEVATSITLVEWHTDYGSSGFLIATGCGGAGGGFPVYPFGSTQINELADGFEIVQDFRMGNWGSSCNYRVQQHHQFYYDGRFRVVSGAFGKGCGTNTLYRPVVRVDIAVNGDANDTMAYSDGRRWVQMVTEDYRVPYAEPDHGPHHTDSRGYYFKIEDSGGGGYHLELDQGQFEVLGAPSGRGADPFLYATLHNPAEGDGDLGVIGTCCNDDHLQGPDQFVNGEGIVDSNLVLWYVSQMVTDASGPDYYCWTVSGEPNPETYPCYSGPMFHPSTDVAVQSPNGGDGVFSDTDCDWCGSGVQAVAENFLVTEDVEIERIVLWGGYFPDNLPTANDDFTVIFHQDAAGLPGTPISTETGVPASRSTTGETFFGIDEYEFVLTLANPVTLAAGTYFVEITNDTSDTTDSFFWETGGLDPLSGIPGSAFDNQQAPGTAWVSDPGADLAFELQKTPINNWIFSDGFESGSASRWTSTSE